MGYKQMSNVIKELYDVVCDRKVDSAEGSYTGYLFAQGIDKILKKVGEEAAETIIAAKNGNKEDIANEVCDLFYHLLVMMAERGVSYDDIDAILNERAKKMGNLKTFKQVDKNT